VRSPKSLWIVAVLSALSSGAGCSHRIDREAIPGKYVANYDKGAEAIELRRDGTYVYDCRLNNGNELDNVDHWTFGYEEGEPRITFSHFLSCLPEYGAKRGYWDVRVERSWLGVLRLPLDPDLNYYYTKRTSE
jgi:hypothetical protein